MGDRFLHAGAVMVHLQPKRGLILKNRFGSSVISEIRKWEGKGLKGVPRGSLCPCVVSVCGGGCAAMR